MEPCGAPDLASACIRCRAAHDGAPGSSVDNNRLNVEASIAAQSGSGSASKDRNLQERLRLWMHWLWLIILLMTIVPSNYGSPSIGCTMKPLLHHLIDNGVGLVACGRCAKTHKLPSYKLQVQAEQLLRYCRTSRACLLAPPPRPPKRRDRKTSASALALSSVLKGPQVPSCADKWPCTRVPFAGVAAVDAKSASTPPGRQLQEQRLQGQQPAAAAGPPPGQAGGQRRPARLYKERVESGK